MQQAATHPAAANKQPAAHTDCADSWLVASACPGVTVRAASCQQGNNTGLPGQCLDPAGTDQRVHERCKNALVALPRDEEAGGKQLRCHVSPFICAVPCHVVGGRL